MIFSRLQKGRKSRTVDVKKKTARGTKAKPRETKEQRKERKEEEEGGILCAKMNTGPRIENVCTTNFSLDCRPLRDFPSLSRPALSPYGIIFSRSYPRGYPMARYTLGRNPLPSAASFRIPCIYPARNFILIQS